ncbi:MAG: hypothetical protein D6767_10480, partial [Candidatus Hydrogenedentota bacterium]
MRLKVFFLLFILAGFFCKPGNIQYKEGPDPYVPQPEQPDAYEYARTDANCPVDGINREISGADNSTEYATCLNLNGTKQVHSFHSREDQDWYVIYARANQRIVIETFDVSDGIETIVQLYYAGTDGSLTKIWGTDTGPMSGNWQGCDSSNNDTDGTNDYGLCQQPFTLSSTGNEVVKINKSVKIKRSPDTDSSSLEPWNSSPYATAIYYVKVTIPPFLYQKGKPATYYIRARGSGDYYLATPTNVQATRDQYTNRIEVTWDSNGGATSYRVLRRTITSASQTISPSVTCSSWPCDQLTDFNTASDINSNGSEKLILVKELSNISYTLKDDDSKTTTDCDTAAPDDAAQSCETTLKSVSSSEELYTDKGVWGQDGSATASNSTMRCNDSGNTINKYKWQGDSTAYKHTQNIAYDATDINGLLPGYLANNTSPGWNDNYIQSSTCSNLPGDTDSADDPKVGEIYYYVVYACDDILESCTGPSSNTEQANSSYLAGGGGSLKINIGTPQIKYVSDINPDGIWLAWEDVTTNKSSSSPNLRIRYSIQRSESSTGPFQEVECQINANSTTADGLLREFDGKNDNSTLQPGKIYYYRIVAQQLIDIQCTGENCNTTNARRGLDETGAGTADTNTNDAYGGDDSCSNDSDYFVSTSVAESNPSNVVAGRLRFLGNFPMCVRVNGASDGYATVTVTNNLSQKQISFTYYDSANGSASKSFNLSGSSGAQQISALCSSINGTAIGGGTLVCSTSSATCNSGRFKYGILNTNNFPNAPATLLADTSGPKVIPVYSAGTSIYGDIYRPLKLEDRTFAEDGYENNQIRVRWAPVAKDSAGTLADLYTIYRVKDDPNSTNTASIGYINVIYHGN